MSNVRPFRHDIEVPLAGESERAVLGAILLDNRLIWEAAQILAPSDFGHERHRLIYAAMLDLAEADEPLEVVSILSRLARGDRLANEITGSEITSLIDGIPRLDIIDTYCARVLESATARRLQVASSGLMGLATDELSVGEKRERAYQMLDSAFGPPSTSGMATIAESLEEGILEIEAARKARAGYGTVGISTGISSLDSLIGGWQRKLYVIAGRPGTGKSSLMAAAALNAVLQDKRVLIFSTEMQRSEIALRMVALQAGLDSSSFNTGYFTPQDWAQLQAGREWAAGLGDRLLIDHTAGPTPVDIRARCKQAARSGGLDLVGIDYLQILSSSRKAGTDTERITQLSLEIKQMQQSLGVPVLLLSQLNRASEAEKRPPQLRDLRQSGGIEQDCDVAMFLWTPEGEVDADDGLGKRVDLFIRKHRGGRCGEIPLRFIGSRFEFREAEDGN